MKRLDAYRKVMRDWQDSHADERRNRLALLIAFGAAALALLIIIATEACGAGEKPPHRYMDAIVTAYCPCKICCGKWADGRTATDTDAYLPGIAADIALQGARVDVPGYRNWVLVDDNGRKDVIRDNHIDVRFPDHATAKAWGRRELRVGVWE